VTDARRLSGAPAALRKGGANRAGLAGWGRLAWTLMPADPRHHLGRLGERLAVAHLERRGYDIVARNHRTRFGEIDVIACDRSTIAFCEVKTRRAGGGAGTAMDAVAPVKQQQVRRMAAAWLAETLERPHAEDLRFDVIAVTIDAGGRLVGLDHLENAF
jgi:putative endonuclease